MALIQDLLVNAWDTSLGSKEGTEAE